MHPRPAWPRWILGLWLVALLAAGGCRRRAVQVESQVPAKAAAVTIRYPAAPGFVKLVEQLAPSVVQLTTAGPVRDGPADWYPPASVAGGLPAGAMGERMQRSLGSGVLVDRSGQVVTNAHLVARAQQVWVRLKEGPALQAKTIGADQDSDIALLGFSPPAETALVPARLGDSEQLQVGEWVLALGNPFGLGVTASVGVVSARESRALTPGKTGLLGFIQTDAAIHPGNSGGPLVNVQGEVVGICTASSGQAGNVGLAVPINLVRKVLPMLRREGRVVRTWVGIYMDAVTEPRAAAAGLKAVRGALITKVISGGPAERAGLRAGDIVLNYDSREIKSHEELVGLVTLGGTGRQIPVSVWRGGKTLRFSLTPEPLPE